MCCIFKNKILRDFCNCEEADGSVKKPVANLVWKPEKKN